MAQVELRRVTRSYPSGEGVVMAVQDVDLEIERGGFVALAGPSGSGKSTCLNMIGAIDAPTSGAVFVDGTNLGALSKRELTRFRKEKIGFVFQDFNLIPVLTAYENVALALHLLGGKRSGKDVRRMTMSLLERVGLGKHWNRQPRQLSGGQQQRVAVARALVKRPAVLVADEPTANLDSATAEDIMKLLKELNADFGTTCILSSHDPLVMGQVRRVVYLRDGQLEPHVARDVRCS